MHGDGTSRFPPAASFAERFASVIAEARGAMAAVRACGAPERRLLDAYAVERLHEHYKLRVEPQIQAAGALWRTAELVAALAEALRTLEASGHAPARESTRGQAPPADAHAAGRRAPPGPAVDNALPRAA